MRRYKGRDALIGIGIVLLVAGCGGSSSSTDSKAPSAGAPRPEALDALLNRLPEKKRGEVEARLRKLRKGVRAWREASRKSAEAKGSNGKETEHPAPVTPRRTDVAAPTSSASLSNEGTKAVAPGIPISRGGDNSVQEYGVEATSAERVQAASFAKAYLDARAARRWAEACAYLASSTRIKLVAFAGKLIGSAEGCASAMQALSAGVPDAARRGAAQIRVFSLRVKGERALLIYQDGDGTMSVLPMVGDGGEWMVAALTGAPLVH
jgi:hypothetical protein